MGNDGEVNTSAWQARRNDRNLEGERSRHARLSQLRCGQRRMGMVLAGVLLVPGVATLWTAWQKFTAPAPPSPLALSLAGAGALAVKFVMRDHAGSLPSAFWQPNASSVPVGPPRYPCESGHHRSGLNYRPDPIGLARPDRWAWDCAHERRCGKRSLPGSTGGTPRNSFLRLSWCNDYVVAKLGWLTLPTQGAPPRRKNEEFYECHIP